MTQAYLFYALQAQKSVLLGAVEASGHGTGTLPTRHIENLPIPRFGEKAERELGELFTALDDKIDLNRRMNETLEASARAVFRDWFVDFGPTRAKAEGRPAYLSPDLWSLFPDRLGDDGTPEGWQTHSIYDLADIVYGTAFASDRFNQNGVGRPMARIRDLSSHEAGQFTDEVHKKEYVIQPGAIVVGMDGEFRAYLWHGVPTLMNQRVCSFVPKASHLRGFLLHSIEPLLAFQEFSAIGTTVIHLGKKDIDRFTVLTPTSPILDAFGALVEPLIEAKVRNGTESRTLAETRDMLLPKLMSGAIRVRDAERAVAALC